MIVPTGLGGKQSAEDQAKLLDTCKDVAAKLKAAGVRVMCDTRDNYSPPWKYNHWELKGVPVRIEIGPRDLAAGKVVAVQRATGKKLDVPLAEVATTLPVRE